jgi:nitrogen PTS system EIIA component
VWTVWVKERKMVSSFEFLAPGAVVANLHMTSSKAVFQQLGQIAEREYGIAAAQAIEGLVERERLGTTGFGAGVAIPHARISTLDHVVGIFLHLEKPVDFKAIDDLPVDLIFCLLSPSDAGSLHLKALAQVSRWMRDRNFVAKLRGAGSSEAIYALFAALESRDAA